MTEAPRFSIVVPAFNAASTLAETLDAVAAQRFDDWECIVVDDGSTDRTPDVCREYALRDARFVCISQVNQGTAGAYNTGAAAARGEFIVICSADDILLPDHLVEMATFIDREPDYDIYSSNGFYLRPDGSRDPVYGPGEISHSMTLVDLVGACFFSVGATYRRTLFDLMEGYRADVFGEDYDFWLRAMAAGARHRYLPKALSLHRLSVTQKSAALEAVYQSDIRLITDLLESAGLSDEVRDAAEASIAERRRLIARLQWGSGGVGDHARRLLSRVLGSARLRRLVRVVKGGSR